MSDFLFGPKAQPAQVQNAATVQQANQSFGNTQQGLDQQQAFLHALQAQNGIQNQSNVYNQLAAQAQGQGPNPAQQALANATGANVANQAALMAGQRGGAANPALLARQAAQQGAGIQQQAAGQGALMQAEQQNQAINSMGNIAGQQVQNLGGAGNAYAQTALGQQGNVYGAIANQNSANVSAQNAANEANKGRGLMGALGGLAQGVTAVAGLGHGGPAPGADMSSFGAPQPIQSPSLGVNTSMGPRTNFGLAHGGAVDGPKSAVGQHFRTMKEGGHVPGQAQVEGDSVKNDTVPTMLSPGEFVLTRSVMNSKDPAKAASAFVAAHLSKKKHGSKKSKK